MRDAECLHVHRRLAALGGRGLAGDCAARRAALSVAARAGRFALTTRHELRHRGGRFSLKANTPSAKSCVVKAKASWACR